MSDPAVFFYDLLSPDCWLVAERITPLFDEPIEWQPVDGRDLSAGAHWDGDRSRIEARAAELELMPLRWPAQLPNGDRRTALCATFAKSIGRTIAFSMAAWRQILNAGRDPSDLDTLLLAAAACEVHPRALIKALEMKTNADALAAAAQRARAAGVTVLPALAIDGGLIAGEQLIGLVATSVVEGEK